MVELIHTHKGTVYAQRNGVLIPVNTDGLVGYWPMSEGSGGTAYDESKNGNTGTIYGAVWTDTANGKALDFDGVDDYVDVPDDPIWDFGDEISVSCWFKTTTNQSMQGLVMHDDSDYKWMLYLTSNSGALNFYIKQSSGVSWARSVKNDGYYADGNWHYMIGIFDKSLSSNRLKLYVDGSLSQGLDVYDENILAGDEGVDIGQWESENEHFDGSIDEVRTYDRALSAQEITNMYEKTRGLYNV